MSDMTMNRGDGKRSVVSTEELMTKGVSLFYHEQERDAMEYLRSVIQEDPTNLRAYYLLALSAQLHSDERTIEQVAKAANLIDRGDAFALGCEGVRFMDYCNFARADDYFEQALLVLPNSIDLWFGRGMLHDYAGQRQKAVGAYLRVVQLDPKNVSGIIALGNAYADVGDYENAYAQYCRGRELAPDTDNPHFRLGRDLIFVGMHDDALFEFRQAVAEEPDQAPAQFYLLATLRAMDKTDDAIEVYDDIRARFADQPDLTAGFYEQFSAWPDAIREYRRALEKNPAETDYHERLASCYRELGQWDSAIAEYRTLLEVESASSSVCDGLAELLLRTGRYDEAAAQAEKAIELDPHDLSAYATLADACVLLGRTEQASELLRRQEQIRNRLSAEYQRKYFGGDPDEVKGKGG